MHFCYLSHTEQPLSDSCALENDNSQITTNKLDFSVRVLIKKSHGQFSPKAIQIMRDDEELN